MSWLLFLQLVLLIFVVAFIYIFTTVLKTSIGLAVVKKLKEEKTQSFMSDNEYEEIE